MNNFLFQLVVFVISIYFGNALYEDQVGKFDWKQTYIGKVSHSSIDISTNGVYVATEDNVVAGINLKDGSLLWRKVLEFDDLGKIRFFSLGSEVTTISGSGPYIVRGWSLKYGLLAYEWVLPASTKDVRWTVYSNKLYEVRLLNDRLEVTAHYLKTGNPAGSANIEAPWLKEPSKCLVEKGYVLCVSSTVVNKFTLSDSSLESYQLPNITDSPKSLESISSAYDSALMTTLDGKQTVIVISGESLITYNLAGGSTVAVRKGSSDHPILILATHSNGGFDFKAVDLADGKEHDSKYITHSHKLADGKISSFECLSRNFLDCFYLIVSEDDSLVLIEEKTVIWVREEALANIIGVEMVDLPVSDEEAAIEKEFANKEADRGLTSGIFSMFYRRVHSQFLQAAHFFTSILGLKEHKGESRTDLVKDQFGLHKLIVIITKASKVYGMENDNGDIIWQFHLRELSPFSQLGELSVPFFIQRTSRHLPFPAICTLLFKQKNTGLSAMYVFNPITGQPLSGGLTLLNYRIKQSMLLPRENDKFIKGLVIVSQSDDVHFFPESTKETALELHQSLYLFTISPDTGVLEGYAFISLDDKNLRVIRVWNVQLPPPIIKVAMKNKAERVHSQGRVLGDRSVLYKYINPHLIAVASHVVDPVHKNLVTIYLIDTVSGAIVFSAVHKRAMPPVHIVHSENWVVYSFFNDKSRRTELVSFELYEGKSQRNTTEFSSLSYALDPLIERQSYIFPHNVMAMRETITEKGITNKHVLVGVSSGGVMEVPWALLDPHRSPEGREEGVLPYTPDLSLPPEAILTYNHTLPLIAGIHTSPSGLESTSLVFIYGLDLFYTRVAPSKTFDVLKDDFEYWLITLVLSGLISAAYITKKLASRKALRQAWK